MRNPIAGQRNERDLLLLTRLESHGRPGRNAESKAERLFAIERKGMVHFKEMTMRSDLNRPIGGIRHHQFLCLAARESFNVAGGEQDLSGDHRLGKFGSNRGGQGTSLAWCLT